MSVLELEMFGPKIGMIEVAGNINFVLGNVFSDDIVRQTAADIETTSLTESVKRHPLMLADFLTLIIKNSDPEANSRYWVRKSDNPTWPTKAEAHAFGSGSALGRPAFFAKEPASDFSNSHPMGNNRLWQELIRFYAVEKIRLVFKQDHTHSPA